MTVQKNPTNPLGPGYEVAGSEMRYRDSFNKTLRDELNRKSKGKRWQITLKFELPPGAYATVLVKRLFH